MGDPPKRTLDYEGSRRLLLLVGLIILLLLALIMYARRVDPTEVAATIFFLPIYMAFLYGGMRGGLAAGALAALAYVVLRVPAIDAVGVDRFIGPIASRSLGYLAFGGVGGWAVQQLGANINKLALYDRVDDETTLHNSRSAMQTIVGERARALRYDQLFSVVLIEVRLGLRDRKARARLMQDLGGAIGRRVRSVDHAFHAVEGDIDLFGAVLPETGSDGTAIVAASLGQVVESIVEEHAVGTAPISVTSVSLPNDGDALDALIERLAAIVKVDFPAQEV